MKTNEKITFSFEVPFPTVHMMLTEVSAHATEHLFNWVRLITVCRLRTRKTTMLHALNRNTTLKQRRTSNGLSQNTEQIKLIGSEGNSGKAKREARSAHRRMRLEDQEQGKGLGMERSERARWEGWEMKGGEKGRAIWFISPLATLWLLPGRGNEACLLHISWLKWGMGGWKEGRGEM